MPDVAITQIMIWSHQHHHHRQRKLTLYVVWQSCLTTMLGMFVFMLYKFKDKVKKKDSLEEGRTEADF